MRVDRGGTQGFQGRPPTKPLVTTGGFPLLRDVTLLCYGAGKGFGFSGFPCRGRKLPFSLISGAETRKIPGVLRGGSAILRNVGNCVFTLPVCLSYNLYMSLGARIRELRTLSALSQAQLAEKIGVNTSAVSLWENDVNESTNLRRVISRGSHSHWMSLRTICSASRTRRAGACASSRRLWSATARTSLDPISAPKEHNI